MALSHCGASGCNIKVTCLGLGDDAVILVDSLEVLVMALEEACPLVLKGSRAKTNVFGGLPNEAVRSVHAYGEDTDILGSFT